MYCGLYFILTGMGAKMTRDLQIFKIFRIFTIFLLIFQKFGGKALNPQVATDSHHTSTYTCRVTNASRVCGDITNFTLKKLMNDIEMNAINDTSIR